MKAEAFGKDDVLSREKVFEIASHISESLNFLHAKNIAHYDVKPDNILYIPATKRYVLSDFGFTSQTLYESLVVGTPVYKAEDVYRIPIKYSIRRNANGNSRSADVFALGASLVDLMYGRKMIGQIYCGERLENLRYYLNYYRLDWYYPRPGNDVFFDLIGEMIKMQPQSRPPARDISIRLSRTSSTDR